jgi:hypothetical protein
VFNLLPGQGLGRIRPSALLAYGLGEDFGSLIVVEKVGGVGWIPPLREYPRDLVEIPANAVVSGFLLESSVGVVQVVGKASKLVQGESARFEVGNVTGTGSSTAKIINIVNPEIFSYNNSVTVESGALKRKRRREQEVLEILLLAA